MARLAINDPFSPLGIAVRTKLLILGRPDNRWDRIRSLHTEHVSPAILTGRGISRPGSAGSDSALVALMRRWFFARKPDAGFLLMEFPATLLQAKIFDEWLDSRHEALDAVLAGPGSPEPVITHYGSLGLLAEALS